MKAVIYCCSTDGRDGHVQDGDGKTRVYSDLAEASAAAKRLEKRMNGPLAKITFTYLPMEITDCCGASVKAPQIQRPVWSAARAIEIFTIAKRPHLR